MNLKIVPIWEGMKPKRVEDLQKKNSIIILRHQGKK
jgi:hypothetical protein